MAAQPKEQTLAIAPQQQVETSINRVKVLMSIINHLRVTEMKDGIDFGIIPHTGNKPTLLLPGMEKLMQALNAVPDYIERRVIVDYDKPLFHYEYECRLMDADNGLAIPGGRGLGLCTSMESSFRWRKAERECPKCGNATIIKGRAEYGGGWVCYTKKGGCGAKFPDGAETIEGQQVGRIENPDIFDQVNSIMKRAKKRALGDAIKGAASVSEFFTVDLEDFAPVDFYSPPSEDVVDDLTIDTDTGEILDEPQTTNGHSSNATTHAVRFNKPNFDFEYVYTAINDLFNGPKHRDNALKKRMKEGVIKPGMTEDAVIDALKQHYAKDEPAEQGGLTEAQWADVIFKYIDAPEFQQETDILAALGVDKRENWRDGKEAAYEQLDKWLESERETT